MQSPVPKPAFQILDDRIEQKPALKDNTNLRLLGSTEQEVRDLSTRACGSMASSDQDRPVGQTPGFSGGSVSQLQASMLEPFVEAEAAAEFMHYSIRSVKQMARDGRIPAHPFGSGPRKRWYFLISELAEHLHAQVNSAHGEAGRDKTQRRVH
jgi:helix-turn-helix protein